MNNSYLRHINKCFSGLLFLAVCLVVFCISVPTVVAQDVHYSLINPRDIEENSDSFHLVDIMTYSNLGFKLGSGQLYFNYNTDAFGANAFVNGKVEIFFSDSSVLNEMVGPVPFYKDFIINDNTVDRFSYSWQPDLGQACLVDENVNYYSDILFTLKIKYLPGGTSFDPGICLEGEAVYIDQTYKACGPVDCSSANCIDFPGMQLFADFYSCSDCRFVYTTADSGVGSLRDALTCAAPGDTIRFAPYVHYDSIKLTSTEIAIDKEILVLAKESVQIYVQGDQLNRTFDILVNGQVTLEGIQITPGTAENGSAIRNTGVLVLRDVTVHGNGVDSLLLNQGELGIEGTNRIKQN